MKVCSSQKCELKGVEQELNCFYKNKKSIDGFSWYCKKCSKKSAADNRPSKEDKTKYNVNYYQENKEAVEDKKREYNKANREKRNARDRKRHAIKKNDPQYVLARALRSRLNKFVKDKSKVGSSVNDIGCNLEFLKNYLECRFKDGMNWGNYGFYGWHIDHILPLDSFDLTDRKQFLIACHYTNLQPLWAGDNLSKGSKIL
jgi:hypothetical protein